MLRHYVPSGTGYLSAIRPTRGWTIELSKANCVGSVYVISVPSRRTMVEIRNVPYYKHQRTLCLRRKPRRRLQGTRSSFD